MSLRYFEYPENSSKLLKYKTSALYRKDIKKRLKIVTILCLRRNLQRVVKKVHQKKNLLRYFVNPIKLSKPLKHKKSAVNRGYVKKRWIRIMKVHEQFV